jgi:hypothetical protein
MQNDECRIQNEEKPERPKAVVEPIVAADNQIHA